MGLSSEDLFSRRVTPLGVYCPKDRMKQERQFATMVLELLHRKVYEEEKEEKEVAVKSEKGEKDGEHDDTVKQQQEGKTGEGVKEEKKEENDISHITSISTNIPPTPASTSTEANNSVLLPPPPSSSSATTVSEKQPERKVSIADHIKPPPAHVRPSLRLTNPDRLVAFNDVMNEDNRQDTHAPRTPANVRGNRSMLHKVWIDWLIEWMIEWLNE